MDDNIRHYICYWFRINNNICFTPMGNNGGCMILRLLIVLLSFIASMLGVILAIYTQDHYPSYISNGLSTALTIVNDNLKELRKYESKNKKESEK